MTKEQHLTLVAEEIEKARQRSRAIMGMPMAVGDTLGHLIQAVEGLHAAVNTDVESDT